MFEDLKAKLQKHVDNWDKRPKSSFIYCTDYELVELRVSRDIALSVLMELQQIELQFESERADKDESD